MTSHIRIRFEEREPFDVERFVAALVELAELINKERREGDGQAEEEIEDE
jgi:hypothetical protein